MFGTGFIKLAKEVGKTKPPRLGRAEYQLRAKSIGAGVLAMAVGVIAGMILESKKIAIEAVVLNGLAMFPMYMLAWYATDYPKTARLAIFFASAAAVAMVCMALVAGVFVPVQLTLLVYPVLFGAFAIAQLRELQRGGP